MITSHRSRTQSGVQSWVLRGGVLCFGLLLLLFGRSDASAASPVNDSFASATQLTGVTNQLEVSSQGATAEAGERSHAGNPALASLWWRWTAPENGVVTVSTGGSEIDTVLAVYTGNNLGDLSVVAENDDAPGLGTSLVAFTAVQGQEYHIAVDGIQGAAGEIRLSLGIPVELTAPRILEQPSDETIADGVGATVTFRVVVLGSRPMNFEWQKGEVPLPGGTNSVYTIKNASQEDTGEYRVVVRNDLGRVTSSVATLNVLSGVDHDLFAGRSILAGEKAFGNGHNYGAGVELGEPMHGGVASGASLWWSWTASRNGLVEIDTLGSVDGKGGSLATVLAIYKGDRVDSLSPVASSRSATVGRGNPSRLIFRAIAGQTFQIAVAGVLDSKGVPATGFIHLQLEQFQDNDQFLNSLTIPAGETRVLDNNVGATEEPGEFDHAGNLGGKSVWWTWVAPDDATYVLDTVGSAIDTVLAVYTGETGTALSLVGEDDNRSDDGASIVKFFAKSGVRYFFAVDGYLGANGVEAGNLVLNINRSLVLNDDFNERVTLAGQTNHISVSNMGAGKEVGEPNHGGNAGGRSVWWTWIARISAPVIMSTRNSSIDTVLAVYTGKDFPSLLLVAENDDSDPLNSAAGSTVAFNAIAGQSYQIVVDGYREEDGTVAAGDIVLTVLQPNLPLPGGNDLFANRFTLSGRNPSAFGNNTNSTEEAGEPAHAGNDGGRSIWWTWVAPTTAAVRVDTIGSNFDTLLGVYTGSSVSSLTLIESDERSAGDGKSVCVFEAVAGVEYQIAVDGFNDGDGADSGRVVLNLRQFDPGVLHANDAFENASPISEPFLTVIGSNIGATREVGEPAHGGAPTGHSVWWTWRASNDGAVTLSTTNSQFDTLLSVYTGAQVDALTLVAENDDIDPGTTQSRVTFQATAGVEYHIAVDGYRGEIGLITLTVSPGGGEVSEPRIEQFPVDQTRFSDGSGGGRAAEFRVVATGSPPLQYQWFHDGAPLVGAVSATLVITNVTDVDAGRYHVAVSNGLGAATTPGVQLTILDVPFNDAFAHRIRIDESSGAARGSILGASKEPSEPDHGGEVGGRSVWWTWRATTNGVIEINTRGSAFDTVLGVYTGDTVSNLTKIAENDDLIEDLVYSSGVIFNAVAGQEYQIAVDATKTSDLNGSVVLTVGPPQIAGVKILPPERLSDGRVRISFADPEGGVAGDPKQFELQQTEDLDTAKALWSVVEAVGSVVSGNYVFEDSSAVGQAQRYYRVLRKERAIQNP